MGAEPVITLHDAHAKVVWANYAPKPATIEELLGSFPWDWVDDSHKQAVKSRFSMCIALREPQEFEVSANVHEVQFVLICRIDPTPGRDMPIIARTSVVDAKVLRLSEGEKNILHLSARGLSLRMIAKMLNLSTSTVATYRSRAKSKLGIKSFAELAIFTFRNLER